MTEQESERDYEFLLFTRREESAILLSAIKDVKEFIKERKLIITGGTAIDFVLRLKGSAIYSNNTASQFPDYDFYSTDPIKDAYDLGDLLYTKYFTKQISALARPKLIKRTLLLTGGDDMAAPEYDDFMDSREIKEKHREAELAVTKGDLVTVNCIGAIHTTTMKVRIIYTTIADITFMPKNIFELVTKKYTVNYDGLKVVAPDWQMMNQHIAVMNPYVNPSRIKKDASRYEKLYSFYPVADEKIKQPEKSTLTTIPYKALLKKYGLVKPDTILSGFGSYAIMSNYIKNQKKKLENVIFLDFNDNEFESPTKALDILVVSVPEEVKTQGKLFNQFMDYDFPTYKIIDNGIEIRVGVIKNWVIPVINYKDGLNIVNVNTLSLFLLYHYHISENQVLFSSYYVSLRHMVANNPIPMFNIPSSFIDGGDCSLADLIGIDDNALRICKMIKSANTDESRSYPVPLKNMKPINYYPNTDERPDPFDYTESLLFQIDGSEVPAGEKTILDIIPFECKDIEQKIEIKE